MNIYGHMLEGHGEKVASAIGASYQHVLAEHGRLSASSSAPEAEPGGEERAILVIAESCVVRISAISAPVRFPDVRKNARTFARTSAPRSATFRRICLSLVRTM